MRLNPKLAALLSSEMTTFALTIGLGFAGGISAVFFAWLMSRTLNEVFINGDRLRDVSVLLWGMLFAAGVRALAIGGSEISANRLAVSIKSRLRPQILEHLFKLGPAYSVGEMGESDVRSGELVTVLMEGVEALDAYFSQYLPQVALAAIIPLTILVFVTPLDPLSGVVLLVTAPLVPIFMVLIGNSAQAKTKRQWQSLSRMGAYLLDVLQGLPTLKLLGRSKAQVDTIARVSEQLRGRTMDVLRVTFLSAFALELVTTISTAVIAVQVGLRLLYGYLGFEEAFFVLLLAPQFYLPLRMLGTRFHAGMSGTAAAERIFEILEVRRSAEAASVNRTDETDNFFAAAQTVNIPWKKEVDQPGDIRFENVSVHYSDGRTALEDVSFEVSAGSRTALVGASGAGKSTIAGLLLGFIEVESGEITWDGVPLKDIPLCTRRERIAWVSQENYLFNYSVEDNIRLGRPEASLDDVRQAAKLAQAHEFIQALPEGYGTHIGEGGVRLSAGQGQRVALARAFLKDSPNLILDEPSAHLDVETELEVKKAMEQLMCGRTVLVIAHRLTTIHQSDQIILLNEGQVEARGTHQELLVNSETYRELVRAYSGSYEDIKPLFGGEEQNVKDAESSQEYSLKSTPSEDEIVVPKKMDTIIVLKHLFGFLASYTGRVALSTLLGWATVASGMGLMATSAYLITRSALHPPIAELQVAIVGVRFFGISRGVFRYLERLVSHDMTLRILTQLRVWLYQAVEPLVPADLGAYRSGDLLARITEDITSLEDFFVRSIAPIFTAMLVVASSALLLSSFHIELGVISAAFLVIAGFGLPWIVHKASIQPGKALIRYRAEIKAELVSGLQGIPALLSFGATDHYLEQIENSQERFVKAQKQLGEIKAAQTAGMELIAQIGTLAVLSAAIALAGAGQIEGVYLGVIALAMLTSYEAIQPLPQAARILGSSLEAAGRLFRLADTQPAVQEPKSPEPIPEYWDVSLRELSFSYPGEGDLPDKLVLDKVSFELPMGKHMAIIGASGAGKTTLVRLLARFWDTQQGSIMLNGLELRAYAGDDLRKHMAIVPQNPYIFTATILDNLRIANPGARMDEIIRAARLAQVHDFIESMPQGYKTWVGEHGLRLSAGERQRIAVARALLVDAPLLILDEATANLDALTEKVLLESIRKAWQGRSLLVITHRLVEVEALDEILVMDRGRVVERGRHVGLLEAGGHYQRMWESQGRILVDR